MPNEPSIPTHRTRRELIHRVGGGLGALALGSMLARDLPASNAPLNPTAAGLPHFAARARSVIWLNMVGAPSQLDMLHHKPALNRHDGELCPKEYFEGQRFAFIRDHPVLMGTPFRFKPCGRSGIEISELLPHLRTVADELAVVHTVHTEEFNHGPAQIFSQTGFGRFGRPTIGAWVGYGLGSENEDLPAYVVLTSGANYPGAGTAMWGSGFLPTVYQGVEFRRSGDPVLFLSNPPGVWREQRRRIIDGIASLNRLQLADSGDPEIATRIAQYELAFRMQMSVPELADISSESPDVLDAYGAKPGEESFSNNCLLARRLVERGVRFVQLYDDNWDHHLGLEANLPRKCRDVDRGMAALIRDLKTRGLLDQTLVVWGGEFGRTPMMQAYSEASVETKTPPGRDHHKDAFTMWMAGGGVKPGTVYGETDDFGHTIVRDPMHINDIHAVVLHLLGLDHVKLTFKYQGRQFRLTDVGGHVPRALLA